VNRPDRKSAQSGWLVGLIALAGGLAAPVSAPVAGPLASPHAVALRASPVAEVIGASLAEPRADPELRAFYAARDDQPLWIENRRVRREAAQLIAAIHGSAADGLAPEDYDPAGLQSAVRAAASGRAYDLARAELMLSEALAAWSVDLHHPKAAAAALVYSDPQFRPADGSRRAVLEEVARAPSLKAGLAAAARMNPIFVQLRAALAADAARGGAQAPLLRANLERARALPPDLGRRYILVDVAAQRLWTYEDGRPVDSMKVVVGKPSEPTPQLAAVIRYAVFRPYWNVPPDLVADSVAPKVLRQGLAYFRAQHLQALSDWSDQAKPLDPKAVNWKAVAAGRTELRVRQLPGPDNMMGRVKFMFPNQFGVYLHDSPLRAFFAGDVRLNSAGCVRLEDAPRLARWLLGDEAVAEGEAPGAPETRTDLPEPVPVYIVYLTAAPTAQGLSIRKDIYHRDPTVVAELAAPPTTTQTQLASRSTGG
jgi:murein L,D-transpeptidase YcbB/YkuD